MNRPVLNPREHREEEGGASRVRHHQAHLCSKAGMNLEACGSGACPKHPEFVHARVVSPLKVRAQQDQMDADIPPPAAPKPCPQETDVES